MRVKLEDVCVRGSSNLKQSDVIDKTGEYPIYGAAGYIGNVDFYHQDQPYVAVVKDGAGIGRTSLYPAKSSVIGTMQYLLPKENVLPEYLCYVVKYMHLEKYFTGATIPHIYFKDYKKEEFNLDTLDRQKEIVNILGRIECVISSRQQELQKLDELIKARFVELFGNLDINDKGWNECSLGEACNKVIRYPTFYGMDYLETGTRVIRIGNILEDGHMELADENYVFVYDGVNEDFPETVMELNDIVMAVRGDGSAAKRIGIIREEELIDSNISPNLIRIKAGKELEPLFLFYYLTGDVGQRRLDAYVNKTAKKNIAAKDIVKVIVPIPPLLVQKQFTDFVNQVDKSKVAVQKALDETKSKLKE